MKTILAVTAAALVAGSFGLSSIAEAKRQRPIDNRPCARGIIYNCETPDDAEEDRETEQDDDWFTEESDD